jgi:hypothetical protein
MYDIPFDRSFLQLSNGIRHFMPSTETKPELTAKASMAQPVSQPAVYANGLNFRGRQTPTTQPKVTNFFTEIIHKFCKNNAEQIFHKSSPPSACYIRRTMDKRERV